MRYLPIRRYLPIGSFQRSCLRRTAGTLGALCIVLMIPTPALAVSDELAAKIKTYLEGLDDAAAGSAAEFTVSGGDRTRRSTSRPSATISPKRLAPAVRIDAGPSSSRAFEALDKAIQQDILRERRLIQ